MTHPTHPAAALEPIETASRDELQALQLERLKWSLRHAYDNVAHYRRTFDAAGVHPDDLHTLADLAKFPFTTKSDLRDNYPFGLFAVPREQVVRVHASSGTTGKPTVVGYTARDIDVGERDGALDPRGRRPAGRHAAQRVRLRALHRRPRHSLRRGAARLHGRADVGRADREAGAADPRFRAEDHPRHAVVHAEPDRRDGAAGWTRPTRR
jgi:hypothetical protein